MHLRLLESIYKLDPTQCDAFGAIGWRVPLLNRLLSHALR